MQRTPHWGHTRSLGAGTAPSGTARPMRRARRLLFALPALLLAAALLAPATPAGAQEPTPTPTPPGLQPVVALFLGFVGPDEDGQLPSTVRAIGSTDNGTEVTCGTADVLPSGDGLGFYLIDVASTDSRDGCPEQGGTVRFLLLYGAIDEGRLAVETGQWLPEVQRLDLSPLPEGIAPGGFVGILPSESGFALVQWTGPDDTPVGHALATLERPVLGVWLFQGTTVLAYIPGAPDFVSDLESLASGDIVLISVE